MHGQEKEVGEMMRAIPVLLPEGKGTGHEFRHMCAAC